MSAEVKAAFPDAKVTLKPSSGGVFDVTVDGTLVFSKHKTGRFPAPGELTGG